MRYFHRLGSGLNVLPLMHEIARKPRLWDADNFRKEFPHSVLTEVNDILIRYPRTSKGDTYHTAGRVDNVVWRHDAASSLPSLRPVLMMLMAAVNAYSLERVFISKLQPGREIREHVDTGTPYTDRLDMSRYHIVLHGLPGSEFVCGDERVQMLSGETWWFDPTALHSCHNRSADDRIHLVADCRVWA